MLQSAFSIKFPSSSRTATDTVVLTPLPWLSVSFNSRTAGENAAYTASFCRTSTCIGCCIEASCPSHHTRRDARLCPSRSKSSMRFTPRRKALSGIRISTGSEETESVSKKQAFSRQKAASPSNSPPAAAESLAAMLTNNPSCVHCVCSA